MNKLVLFLALVCYVVAEDVADDLPGWQYGYMKKYGIPAAERVRQREEQILSSQGRIAGGEATALEQIPYAAGLISDIIGTNAQGICGGTVLTPTRILTAAHCWNDGINRAWRFTVVTGTTLLFSGGSRIRTDHVAVHPGFVPRTGRHDVSVVYLPIAVQLPATVSWVAMPSDALLDANITGMNGTIAGYGMAGDDAPITSQQSLRHVTVPVISILECFRYYGSILNMNHLCTSGAFNRGPCNGDLGAGLVINFNGKPTVVGIASIISSLGCERGIPAVYTSVMRYEQFINHHLLW